MNTIGENIALFRKQKGMTQEAFASAVGVSPQSVSKWETGTNMPDIMLLPVIADIFGVSIDVLFGHGNASRHESADEAFGLCRDSVLEHLFSCMYNPNCASGSFEEAFKSYKNRLEKDSKIRTAVIRKHGVVYYRDEIGGILLKRPKEAWYELFEASTDVLSLLSDGDFKRALLTIIKSGMSAFTVTSLASLCKIEDTETLEENFKKSGLFSVKSLDIGGKSVSVYELVQGQRLFLLFTILTYSEEYAKYEDIYTGFYGDVSYYLP